MAMIKKLIDLTKKIYDVNASSNLINDINGLHFISDDFFDWFVEGVFVYQPDIEGDKGVKYIRSNNSDLYEFDDGPVYIYIRKDYHLILSDYYKKYNITDVENKKTVFNNYLFTDFIINKI